MPNALSAARLTVLTESSVQRTHTAVIAVLLWYADSFCSQYAVPL